MEPAICEKIISSVDRVIKADTQLDEFDVIYSTGDTNQSPVVHIEHKLALESWCFEHLYSYSYCKLNQYKQSPRSFDLEELLKYTQICLLLVPEVAVIWNIRKKLLLKNLSTIDTDDLLTRLVLSRKPKCLEAFTHRRWLLSSFSDNSLEDGMGLKKTNLIHNENFFDKEFQLCIKTANMKENNYHSWNHRAWILDNMMPKLDASINTIYAAEYRTIHDWIAVHVSEHSGMHYMLELITKICSACKTGDMKLTNIRVNSFTELYEYELGFNKDLIMMYPGHEALFYHRKGIFLRLSSEIGGCKKESSPPHPATKRSCVEVMNSEWNNIVQKELKLHIQITSPDHQKKLSDAYIKWFNQFICLK